MRRLCLILPTALLLTFSAQPAFATAITPAYTTFGTLGVATFGGSDIPNDAVAITTIPVGDFAITLGLTATQRFADPVVGNNGAGVFSAQPGDDSAQGQATYGMWNFDFYAAATGTGLYGLELLYDFDPALGTDSTALGRVTTTLTGGNPALQDSWNLGMGFLASGILGAAPSFGPFSPTANGEYSFALIARGVTGAELGRAAILVDVGDVPAAVPEPTTLVLLGSGLLMGASRVRRRLAHAKK